MRWLAATLGLLAAGAATSQLDRLVPTRWQAGSGAGVNTRLWMPVAFAREDGRAGLLLLSGEVRSLVSEGVITGAEATVLLEDDGLTADDPQQLPLRATAVRQLMQTAIGRVNNTEGAAEALTAATKAPSGMAMINLPGRTWAILASWMAVRLPLFCWPAAVVILLLWYSAHVDGRAERRRAQPDQCAKCGYALDCVPADAPCPECGGWEVLAAGDAPAK